jgi:hypothetical protein
MALPRTVESILAFVNELIPDANRQLLLDLLNSVHEEICMLVPATKTTITIPVGGSVQEYDLQADVAWVRHCTYYATAASYGEHLFAVSVADMDKTDSQWRQVTAGVPRKFYIDAGKVGLHPKPQAAIVSSYPQIRIEGVTVSTLAADDSIPDAIPSVLAYRYGTAALAAAQLAPEENRNEALVNLYSSMYERAKRSLEIVMARRNRQHVPQSYPANYGRRPV